MIKKGDVVIGLETGNSRLGGYPALDYDTSSQKFVETDTQKLQQKFHLGNAILIKTRHGFHVIFFWDNNLTWEKIIEIIDSSNCDPQFKEFKRIQKISRIRVQGGDLKIIKTIKSPYHKNNELGDFFYENYQRAIKNLSKKLYKYKNKK